MGRAKERGHKGSAPRAELAGLEGGTSHHVGGAPGIELGAGILLNTSQTIAHEVFIIKTQQFCNNRVHLS